MYIGIDPGQKGGIAVISDRGEVLLAVEMPAPNLVPYYIKHTIVPITQKNDCCRYTLYIEKAQAMPKQGVTGVFTYGVGYGKILGAFETCGIIPTEIRPMEWKKYFGLIKENKGKIHSVRLAEKLFPGIILQKPPAKKTGRPGRLLDGKAEALLIAEYARQKYSF